MSGVGRMLGIALNTRDDATLSRFYVDALGFSVDLTGRLQLGGVGLRLRRVDATSPPVPLDLPGWSPLFQHFAIVVSDMGRAMERLETVSGWTPISIDGPQRLPAEAGGVTAFKFRDPEGHPLELLAFPDAMVDVGASPFVRIDHTAISVADVARSLSFYAALGLHVAGRSLNVGVAQQRLDGIVDAEVDVVGLASATSDRPHLELLGYRGDHDRSGIEVAAPDDPVATRVVFTVDDEHALDEIASRLARPRDGGPLLLRDPDGHLLEFVVDR